MAVLVIDKQGASVGLQRNRLTITDADENLVADVPKMQIERVLVVGRVVFSQQALDFFFADSIPVSFISVSGQFKGFLCGGLSKNVFLRMNQYQLYNDTAYRLATSKAIVEQKVDNTCRFLAKCNKFHKRERAFLAVANMRSASRLLKSCASVDEVMGVEGRCAAEYFDGLGSILADKAFSFSKRTSNPPLDPVNAMLSLGYTLLLSDVVSALYSVGLDPYVGYLHSLDYGRVSLGCDLQEELRFVIDRLVLKLINNNQIKPSDFESGEDDPIKLTRDARKIFYNAYDDEIGDQHDIEGRQVSFREIIRKQAELMNKCIMERSIYKPFKWSDA